MSVTVASAELPGLYKLFAVMVTSGTEGSTCGAVYIPVDDIVPIAEFPPPIPFTSQLTPELGVPMTVAVSCRDWPVCTFAVDGEIEIVTGAGTGRTVTIALADSDGSDLLLAVSTIEVVDVTAGGLVYSPNGETVPDAEVPPTTPLASHAKSPLVVPGTAALNCRDVPACRTALVGERAT